jgi:hypothetical protein
MSTPASDLLHTCQIIQLLEITFDFLHSLPVIRLLLLCNVSQPCQGISQPGILVAELCHLEATPSSSSIFASVVVTIFILVIMRRPTLNLRA